MRKTKKTELPDDCMPRCETCAAGQFEPGEDMGDCHLFPMKWHIVSDDFVAAHDPAERSGYCLHYKRKVN